MDSTLDEHSIPSITSETAPLIEPTANDSDSDMDLFQVPLKRRTSSSQQSQSRSLLSPPSRRHGMRSTFTPPASSAITNSTRQRSATISSSSQNNSNSPPQTTSAGTDGDAHGTPPSSVYPSPPLPGGGGADKNLKRFEHHRPPPIPPVSLARRRRLHGQGLHARLPLHGGNSNNTTVNPKDLELHPAPLTLALNNVNTQPVQLDTPLPVLETQTQPKKEWTPVSPPPTDRASQVRATPDSAYDRAREVEVHRSEWKHAVYRFPLKGKEHWVVDCDLTESSHARLADIARRSSEGWEWNGDYELANIYRVLGMVHKKLMEEMRMERLRAGG
ncbi:hypothetical protein B0T17DRAFT_7305 [Bombardia bombarda]|uniref:Uncharacterized protein n=1 Tax=Bombardia bombarda TaxID=252184 RepID=A0AA40CD63_9PEZI|nr:hypothetical protein B0T17DRAFT_7305 [Bombardia bombarda]